MQAFKKRILVFLSILSLAYLLCFFSLTSKLPLLVFIEKTFDFLFLSTFWEVNSLFLFAKSSLLIFNNSFFISFIVVIEERFSLFWLFWVTPPFEHYWLFWAISLFRLFWLFWVISLFWLFWEISFFNHFEKFHYLDYFH